MKNLNYLFHKLILVYVFPPSIDIDNVSGIISSSPFVPVTSGIEPPEIKTLFSKQTVPSKLLL